MLKELSEDLHSIKKIQSEMKGILLEIRTIYRDTTVDWMKPRFKSMIWNMRNQRWPVRTSRKSNPKK